MQLYFYNIHGIITEHKYKFKEEEMLLLYCILIGIVFTAAEVLLIKKEHDSKKQQILSIIRTFSEISLLIKLLSLAQMTY